MKTLDNRVAVITGASQGQGAAEASLFAKNGAAVALCDVADNGGESIAKEIRAEGGVAKCFHLDVSKEIEWQKLACELKSWQGRVDVLINNAGIIGRKGIIATDTQEWERVLSVNLLGPFLGMKYMAPLMRDSGGGSIVNIASVAGMIGYYDAAYTASKWGLRGLSRTAALELAAWNIRVNVISPGLIVSPMNASMPFIENVRRSIPRGVAGTPEDVAKIALFLASDDSNFINGEDITADGGMMAGSVLWRPLVEAGVISELPP
jgi:3alpha(or 20beta)-hydroxysteroid dehydrogenase